MTTEIHSRQRLLMAQACETLDSRMKEIEEIALTISMDQQFISLSSQKTNTEILEAIRKLNSYTTISSFLQEIIIFQNLDNLFYSSQGTVYPSVFLKAKGFTDENITNFLSLVQKNETVLQYYPQQQVLMYFQPIPLFSTHKTGCAIFMVDQNSFAGLFSQKNIHEYGSVLLLDNQNIPIYRMDAQNLFNDKQLLEASVKTQNNGDVVFTEEGKECYVVMETMQNVPWRLIAVLPMEWVFARIHVMNILVTMAAALVLASGLVIFFTKQHYSPIRSLVIRSGITQDENGHVNEIAQLDYALESFRENVYTNLNRLKSSLILRLLQGENANRNEVLSTLQSMGILCSTNDYHVLALRVPIELYASLETIKQIVEDKFGGKDHAHAACFETNDCAFCMLISDVNHLQPLMETLEGTMNRLGCTYEIGISQLHKPAEAGTAYLEAMLALENPGGGQIHRIETMEVLLPEQDAFETLVQDYASAVRLLDDSAAFALLDDLHGLIQRRRNNCLWRYYAFRLSETMAQLILEDVQFSHHALFPQMAKATSLLLTLGSVDELTKMLKEITKLCLKVLEDTRMLRRNSKDMQLMEWFEKNLCSSDLSLEACTQKFGYSSTYWSRRFQELSGSKFSDMVWSRRLMIVKEKMLKTDLPIKEIVESVGYWNISSFSRRFKQEEGMTANQWREIERQKDVTVVVPSEKT